MAFFNQNSLLLTAIILCVVIALSMVRWQSRSRILRAGIVAWSVFIALAVIIAVRYPTDTIYTATTINEIETTLTNDRPTFVMLYSHL